MVKLLLEWSGVGFRGGAIGKIRETGRLPYGVFDTYVRAHDTLAKACRMNGTVQKKNLADARIWKLYVRAVRELLPQHPSSTSAVVEPNPPGDSPIAKFRNKTARTGRQYFSSKCNFKRDRKRRRSIGGGRHMKCSTIHEMLAM